jgi:hypothetical protein
LKNVEDYSPGVLIDVVHHGDSGKEVTKSIRGKIHIRSSHYYVIFSLDIANNYIEFNFSIPKYFYGNNIAQFIRPVDDLRFNMGIDFHFNKQRDILYKRLNTALNRFFREAFPDYYVDWTRLEINRIDLCFNQIFMDKFEAKRYLDYQKKMNLRNMRVDGRRFQNYRTSMMYVGDDYAIKIYQKGAEYEKHDRKEHEKINEIIRKANAPDYYGGKNGAELGRNFDNQKGNGLGLSDKDYKRYYDVIRTAKGNKSYFDVEFLQSLADRTLRYEMEFKKSMISKIFKKYCFRTEDVEYQEAMREFKHWWNKSKSARDMRLIPKDFHKEFKQYVKFKDKVLTCYRVLDEKEDKINNSFSVTRLNEVHDFGLSQKLIVEMVNYFRRFVLGFQVKYAENEESFMTKVIAKNKQIRFERQKIKDLRKMLGEKGKEYDDKYKKYYKEKILQTTRMRYIYLTLRKYGSWENMWKSGEFTKSTYHRYKKQFEMLGMDKSHISSEQFNYDTDYLRYYELELTNLRKLRPVFR